MTARTLASPVQELARLRAEQEQLRALIVAADPTATPEYWRSLFADAHRADLEDAYRQGREDMGREYEQDWAMIARPIARGGPAFAELELRRWGPGGRARFGDPREGDYAGGPVPTW